jgi:hypothetical protein
MEFVLRLHTSLCQCFEFHFLTGNKELGHGETPRRSVTETIDIPKALVIDYLTSVVTSSTIIAWQLDASKSE